jgi:hypothetical protein
MKRKFSLPTIVLSCFAALAIAGCGGGSGETEFTESEAQTAEELAEAEAYEKAMQSAAQEQAQQGN